MAFLTHWWRFFLGKVVFFRFSRRCAHHFACTTTAFASPTRQQQQQQTEKQKQTKNDRDRLANRRRWPDVGHRKRFIFIFFHWLAVTSSGRDHAPGLIMQMPTWLILSSLYPGTEVANPFQLNPVKKNNSKETRHRNE